MKNNEISVNVNIDESSSIIINEVYITTQNFDEAKKIIENQLKRSIKMNSGCYHNEINLGA